MCRMRLAVKTLGWFLVVGLAFAAACAPPAAMPSSMPVPTATWFPTSTHTPAPTATLTATPFVPKATFRIVSEAPASYDVGLAAQLAIEKLAGPLNDLQYAVEFQAYDDRDDVDAAVQIAREVIADPKVLCGVGPFSSRVTINVTDLYHMAKLAFISPSATHPKVTDRGYPEVNRVSGRNDVMGAAAARFAAAQGLKQAYVLTDDGDFSSQVARAFKAEASKSGLAVVGDLRATVERGNIEAAAAKVQSAQPDFVFYTGFTWQASPFFKAVREAGYRGILFAVDPNPDVAEQAGPLALEGGMYYVTTGLPAVSGAAGQGFIADFQTEFGKPPGVFAAEAYDAAGICLRAIEDAVRANNGSVPTRQQVAEAVRAVKEYPGITGTFSFSDRGDPLQATYLIKQVTHLSASKWNENPVVLTLQLPPP